MESGMGNLIAYLALFILLVLSFYFSFTETAFTALNRIRIKNMAEKGSKRAKLTLTIYDNFGKLLSTLLVGTNMTNIVFTAICTVLFVNSFGDIGATFAAAFTTVIVVIFAEVTPKALAKAFPEKVALFCAPIAKFFLVLFTPFNAFFALWQRWLSRVFKSAANDGAITEDELLSVVKEARQNGVIDEGDEELIQNVIELHAQKAKDILTPRVDVVAISKDADTDEIANCFFDTGFSRIPVYDETIDNIIGILHTRDFLKYVLKKNIQFESILSPAVFVPPLMEIGEIFNLLQKEKSHMAIVIDEHGGFDGIVTMEDIFEELMGEIWDESDTVIEPFVSLEENKYLVLCSADTYAFLEYFNLSKEYSGNMPSTLSGWIVQTLGKLPVEGDTFRYKNLTITVSKTERRRALECIVTMDSPTIAEDE